MIQRMNNHATPILSRRDVWIAVAFFLAAFLVRFVELGALTSFTGDEAMHVASAANYTERGYFGPDNWYHPPLKHVLLYGSIKLFGDNPYGWRMRNVLFGAATVPLLYVLTSLLFGQTAAVISAALLLLDPLHILFSRTTYEDIPAVFFLTAALLLTVKAIRNGKERDWAFTGMLFGLSIALRLYCANALLVVLLCVLVRSFKREGTEGILRTASYLILLPFTVYLLAYSPWFHRGYSLGEWFMMQIDALRELRTVSSFNSILTGLGGPGNWFIREIAIGFKLSGNDGWSAYTVIMNNLPVWLLIIPAVLYLLATSIKERHLPAILIGVVFCALYLPFLYVKRPIFLYSAVPLLPFGFLALGCTAERLLKRWAYLFIALATGWSLFLYPLVVGITIPDAFYQPILSAVKIYMPH